jgi:uncharacterized protein YegJ (DUF2314 family)
MHVRSVAISVGLIVALAGFVPLAFCADQLEDRIVTVWSEDAAMKAAIRTARDSLPDFVRRLQHPRTWENSFLIKARFERFGQVEHIWVEDLSLVGATFHGVLANEPRLPGLKFKQPVAVDMAQVSDWMYLSNNRLVGGYTLRELRRREPPEERARNDKLRGYSIED